MKRLAIVTVLALASCKSSAPYTVPAAAINTGIAVGAALGQRAAGGCYATCTNGTVCNPQTGKCESRSPGDFCEEAPGGGVRCIPLVIGKEQPASSEAAVPVGVSPATGETPPPPSEASPRGP